MSCGRSGGLNYYNIYNKDIGTSRINVLFAGRQTDKIVLIYIGIVFFLYMGEEESFTNILDGK